MTPKSEVGKPPRNTSWRIAFALIERVCDDLLKHISEDIGNKTLALETEDMDDYISKEDAFMHGFNHGLEMAAESVRMYRSGDM